MLLAVLVTCALNTPSTPKPARPRPLARRAPVRASPRYSASELYSLRARRRFASYLRLRLLELREEGLDRAADAVERRIPIDDLFKHP